jgi:hypothetical protein
VDEELEAKRRADYANHAELLTGLPGGASLIAQYEHRTSFHDAIALDVSLSMRGKSLVTIEDLYPTIFEPGRLLVTFEIGKVIDANLDLFGENILFALLLRRPTPRPDRHGWLTRTSVDGDIEFGFEATCGLQGFIVARDVSVRWTKVTQAPRA